jgi:hypothetical protein
LQVACVLTAGLEWRKNDVLLAHDGDSCLRGTSRRKNAPLR